jgi:hypothetical protein
MQAAMKKTVFIIGAMQVLLAIAIAVKAFLDPAVVAGEGTAYVIPQVYALLIAMTIVPAALLAYTDRWQWLGVVFALLPLIPLGMMLSA